MYPKRLILDDARQLGIGVLPLDVNASDAHVPGRAGRSLRRAAAGHPRRAARGRRPSRAAGCRTVGRTASGWRCRGQGHQRGRGRAGRGRPAVRDRSPTSGTAPGWPDRWSSGWWWPGRSTPCTASAPRSRCAGAGRSPGATCCCRWPSWTAGTGPPGAGHAPSPRRRTGPTASDHGRSGRRRAPGSSRRRPASRRRRPRSAHRTCSSRSTSATPEDGEAPSGLPEMTGAERVRAELEVLGLDASRHVLDFYQPLLDASGSPARATCCAGAARPRCWSPG